MENMSLATCFQCYGKHVFNHLFLVLWKTCLFYGKHVLNHLFPVLWKTCLFMENMSSTTCCQWYVKPVLLQLCSCPSCDPFSYFLKNIIFYGNQSRFWNNIPLLYLFLYKLNIVIHSGYISWCQKCKLDENLQSWKKKKVGVDVTGSILLQVNCL